MIETLLYFLIIASVTITSNSEEFSAAITYGGDAELAVQSFVLYNRTHEIIYQKEMLNVHTFFISDQGSVFALNERELYFYDPAGEEIYLRNLEYPNGFGFSLDNSLFFASDKQGIFAYSNLGELIHEFRPGRLFACAGEGKRVAIISTDTLFLYDSGILKGTKILSTPYARRLTFSDDSRSLILDVPGGVEVLHVLPDGEIDLE